MKFLPLPVGRAAHTAVLLHGLVYVGGGFEGKSIDESKGCYRLDIYNVYADQWSTSPITTPHCWFAMTVLDNKLIIAGGETKSGEVTNKVLVFDDGEWKHCKDMPTARTDAAAVGYQSMLVVVGGQVYVKDKWIKLATTELLDTTNGCWYTCDDLPKPHLQLKMTIMNNMLYGGNYFWCYTISTSIHCFTRQPFKPPVEVAVAPRHSLVLFNSCCSVQQVPVNSWRKTTI